MKLYDASGKPLLNSPPQPLTSAYCRSVYYQGPTRHDVVSTGGEFKTEIKNDLVRAQVPHLVTMLAYSSAFQLQPTVCEYFVYAPMDYKSSVKLALTLWRRWEKAKRKEWETVEDLRNDYPKIEDASVSEPIDDNFFAEMWRTIRQRKHRCAGHPDDPFAFTSLERDVRVYHTADFQKDLVVTV